MYRLDAGRDKKAFDALTISASLARGQMLVMTCLPNRPGSLGYHFFSDRRAGRADQKLLILRLAQAQHDDFVVPGEMIADTPPLAIPDIKPDGKLDIKPDVKPKNAEPRPQGASSEIPDGPLKSQASKKK
jgi:hypothetical protein